MAVEARELLGLHTRRYRLLREAVTRVRRRIVGSDAVARRSRRLLPLALVHQGPLVLRRLESPLLALGGVELLRLSVVRVEARAGLHRAQAAGMQVMRRHLVLHALATNIRRSVGVGVGMRLRLALVGVLGSSVTLGGSRPLDFASLVGVNALATLSDCAAMPLGASSAYGSDGEVVMLLQFHVHVTLVQRKFAPLVQLLVEGLVMVVGVHLRQVVEEAAVPVARFRIVEPLLTLLLPLDSQRHRLRGRLRVASAQPVLLEVVVIIWQLSPVPRLHERLRAQPPILRRSRLHGGLTRIRH